MNPGKIEYIAKEKDVAKIISEVGKFIKDDLGLLTSINGTSGVHGDIRNSIKHLFDLIESNENERYIGILEWAFVCALEEAFPNIRIDKNFESIVFRKFSNHTNVQIS